MFRKTLIATALSGALAFTGAATPAAADPGGQDYARALLGLAIIGAIANSANNNRNAEVARNSYDSHRYDGYDPAPSQYGHRGRRDQWRELPAQCEFAVRTRRGWTEVFGKQCLQHEGVRVNRLPDQCEFRIRTNSGRRQVYGADCLENHGYTVEARRRHERR